MVLVGTREGGGGLIFSGRDPESHRVLQGAAPRGRQFYFILAVVQTISLKHHTLTLQTLLFWKKQGFSPKKARVFLFAEPLKSLEKEGKTQEKAREIGKRKKQGNRKKQGLEDQGNEPLFNLRFAAL